MLDEESPGVFTKLSGVPILERRVDRHCGGYRFSGKQQCGVIEAA